MLKRTQNRVAESRVALPTAMVYSMIVWLVSGRLFPTTSGSLAEVWQGGWVQLACFFVSVYLITELNNSNALIRIYSRTVSCAFIVLMCAGNFLFSSVCGSIAQVCMLTAYLALFRTYQDKASMGWTYYAFLCLGLVSVFFIQIVFFVPVLWLLMAFQLSSLSWRTFFASFLGILTPYWFILPLLLYKGNVGELSTHFAALTDFQPLFTSVSALTVNELLLLTFVVALGITGTIHYQRKKSGDNIRIRLFYDCFILMWIATAIFVVLQPQHYDVLIRLLIINVAPLIAHFLALTNTRITNIAFYAICAVALLVTFFNLWRPLLLF